MRGIYAIKNVQTGCVYYGQAVSIERRLKQHRGDLRRNVHGNRRLQRSWNKHGALAFTFTPLFVIPYGDMTKWETAIYDGAKITGKSIYNIARPGDPFFLGRTHSKETRAKISAAKIGNKNGLGSKHSEEWCANMSAFKTGKKRAPFSNEWRANMSAAHLGKCAPGQCAAANAAVTGKKKSVEHRAAISRTLSGRKLSEEHRANISLGLKRKKEKKNDSL